MATFFRVFGLVVVLAAAAVLSFAALRDLAIAVRVHEQLAFLLPIAVDAGAAVSCTVWLSPTVQADARRFACWLTWLLLGATVIGNAAQQGMAAHGITPPWQVAVLVGAIPPAIVGGVVHLLVLVNRTTPDPVLKVEDEAAQIPAEALPDWAGVDERGLSQFWETAPALEPPAAQPTQKTPRKSLPPPADIDPELEQRARELIAAGRGRVVLQQELRISEYRAKQLVKTLTNGQPS
jgi:hypothetical protein